MFSFFMPGVIGFDALRRFCGFGIDPLLELRGWGEAKSCGFGVDPLLELNDCGEDKGCGGVTGVAIARGAFGTSIPILSISVYVGASLAKSSGFGIEPMRELMGSFSD